MSLKLKGVFLNQLFRFEQTVVRVLGQIVEFLLVAVNLFAGFPSQVPNFLSYQESFEDVMGIAGEGTRNRLGESLIKNLSEDFGKGRIGDIIQFLSPEQRWLCEERHSLVLIVEAW